MRDIIFRAKAVSTNKWVYGSLVKEHVDDWIEYSIIDKDGDTYIIHEETIGQYTGLKDQKEIKIYEGDIVRVNCVPSLLSEVVYNQDECRFILKQERPTECKWTFLEKSYHSLFEIVGNIKENPELLEKRK